MNEYDEDFWKALDNLIDNSEIVIDRPKGTLHPKYPNFIYQVDYGKNEIKMLSLPFIIYYIETPINVSMHAINQSKIAFRQSSPHFQQRQSWVQAGFLFCQSQTDQNLIFSKRRSSR